MPSLGLPRSASCFALFLTVLAGEGYTPLAWADDTRLHGRNAEACPDREEGLASGDKVPAIEPWFFVLGAINSYPRLKATEEEVRWSIKLPFHLASPAFHRLRTFPDFRDDGLIWTPYVGFGRNLSAKWTVFGQVGLSGTPLCTKDQAPGIVGLPFAYDVRFLRTNFLCGLGTTYYPWKMPAARAYSSWGDRLKNIRPFVTSTVNYNRIGADTKVKAGFVPLANLVRVHHKDLWQSASLSVNAGLSIPLSAASSLAIGGQYVCFADHGSDFSGPGLSVSWKYAWGGKKDARK